MTYCHARGHPTLLPKVYCVYVEAEYFLSFSGPLPRIKDKEIKSLPKYEPKDKWTAEKAFFGQNDYIGKLHVM